MDLGLDECQPWPSHLQLAAPYAYRNYNSYPYSGGPPTDFTIDTSGAGVQPAPSSPDWQNLVTVKAFRPPLTGQSGHISHVFQILPQDGSLVPATSPLQNLSIALSDPVGTSLAMNVAETFPLQTRTCCPTFTAAVQSQSGSTSPLPNWLSLTTNLVQTAAASTTSPNPYYYYNYYFYTSGPALDVGLALQMNSQPGPQAVGNFTIILTSTSVDQPPLVIAESFTLRVSSPGHA